MIECIYKFIFLQDFIKTLKLLLITTFVLTNFAGNSNSFESSEERSESSSMRIIASNQETNSDSEENLPRIFIDIESFIEAPEPKQIIAIRTDRKINLEELYGKIGLALRTHEKPVTELEPPFIGYDTLFENLNGFVWEYQDACFDREEKFSRTFIDIEEVIRNHPSRRLVPSITKPKITLKEFYKIIETNLEAPFVRNNSMFEYLDEYFQIKNARFTIKFLEVLDFFNKNFGCDFNFIPSHPCQDEIISSMVELKRIAKVLEIEIKSDMRKTLKIFTETESNKFILDIFTRPNIFTLNKIFLFTTKISSLKKKLEALSTFLDAVNLEQAMRVLNDHLEVLEKEQKFDFGTCAYHFFPDYFLPLIHRYIYMIVAGDIQPTQKEIQPIKKRIEKFNINTFFYGDEENVWKRFEFSDKKKIGNMKLLSSLLVDHIYDVFDRNMKYIEKEEIAQIVSQTLLDEINRVIPVENAMYSYLWWNPYDYGI